MNWSLLWDGLLIGFCFGYVTAWLIWERVK
jgi:hypothetical protein